MNYSDYVIYVDESGDHGMEPIDPAYPIFVLDFCIFRKKDYINTVVPRIQMLKFKYFGHDMVILHEHDIRKQKQPFGFLKNLCNRNAFMAELNGLMETASFTIIAAAVHKKKLAHKHDTPGNPYEAALTLCMERTYVFLRECGQHEKITHIVVEKRGKREDQELELAFRRIQDGANTMGKMPNFEIVFADKKTNSAGLQLADLTARPIGRYVFEPDQPNRAWDAVKLKLHRSPEGIAEGWGLETRP